MRRILKAFISSIIAFLFVANVVFAATYHASITITESGGVDYTVLPLMYSMTTSNLTSNGFMEADALDSRVLDGSDNELPHLFASDRLLFVDDLRANNSINDVLTLGNSDLTSMPIIVGYDGYITTADAAALEPGDDFELEISGYFKALNTTATTISKGNDFIIQETDTGDINATIWKAAVADQSHLVAIQLDSVYGATWRVQTFTCGVTGLLTKLDIDLAETGNPAGNMVIGIYAVDGSSKPTGAPLGSYTMLATDVGALATKSYTLDTPASLTAATEYAIVMSVPNGDGANCISWYRNHTTSPNSYASGVPGFSADSGATWTMSAPAAGVDKSFKTYMSTPLTITTNIADGLHTVIIAADTTDFTITVDTVEEDSVALGGASIGNNANNWLFMLNNIIPYANYIKLTVGGTLVAWYQPVAIISGTTLPDREGAAQNGTITWGTNPADIDITLGSLVSYSQPAPALPPTAGGSAPVLPVITQPAWTSTQTMTDNPAYPLVHAFDEATDFTENQIWIFFASGLMITAMIFVFRFFPHVAATMVVGIVVSGLWVAMGIYPFWVIFVFVVGLVASLMFERTPSV